jgi:hypothetical protein
MWKQRIPVFSYHPKWTVPVFFLLLFEIANQTSILPGQFDNLLVLLASNTVYVNDFYIILWKIN